MFYAIDSLIFMLAFFHNLNPAMRTNSEAAKSTEMHMACRERREKNETPDQFAMKIKS